MVDINAEKIDAMGDQIARGASKVTARASSEMRNLLADVEELLGRVTNIDDADLARVRERVQASVGRARESVVDGTRQARERVTAAGHAADEYAHDSPWTLVGVAAIAGIALGAVLSRR